MKQNRGSSGCAGFDPPHRYHNKIDDASKEAACLGIFQEMQHQIYKRATWQILFGISIK